MLPSDANSPGRYSLVWVRGVDCEGCTIAALGDPSAGGFEGLFGAPREGLSTIDLIHPLFALETGEAFMDRMRSCARGLLGPYALLVESAVTELIPGAPGWFESLGEEDHQPMSIGTWLDRLAPGADFVAAVGDCAVWGGPHSIAGNPTQSTGVSMWLGSDYRSRLGAPVINLPGCAVQAGVLATVADLVAWACGRGSAPELDEHNRPRLAYGAVWKGALALWET